MDDLEVGRKFHDDFSSISKIHGVRKRQLCVMLKKKRAGGSINLLFITGTQVGYKHTAFWESYIGILWLGFVISVCTERKTNTLVFIITPGLKLPVQSKLPGICAGMLGRCTAGPADLHSWCV